MSSFPILSIVYKCICFLAKSKIAKTCVYVLLHYYIFALLHFRFFAFSHCCIVTFLHFRVPFRFRLYIHICLNTSMMFMFVNAVSWHRLICICVINLPMLNRNAKIRKIRKTDKAKIRKYKKKTKKNEKVKSIKYENSNAWQRAGENTTHFKCRIFS